MQKSRDAATERRHSSLPGPTSQEVLDAVLELGREIHLDMNEKSLVERFLRVLSRLFPGRKIAVRIADVRANRPARVYCQAQVKIGSLSADSFTPRKIPQSIKQELARAG